MGTQYNRFTDPLPDFDSAGKAGASQTEIDFGTTPVESGSFTITDSNVDPTSYIVAQVAYVAPTGKDLDELDMDTLSIACSSGSSGTFTMFVRSTDGSYLADTFKINYRRM